MLRICLQLLIVFGCGLPLFAQADSASLFAQIKAADSVRYTSLVSKGAEFTNTTDNKSFTVWWTPTNVGRPAGVIVVLHGHANYATSAAYLWQPYAEKYGYALLTLQWWFGGGEATSDYYEPGQMYPLISDILKAKGVTPGTVLFAGFSRGSANSYAVTVLDATSTGQRYFGLTFSDSGSAQLGYPPNQQIDSGVYGTKPFADLKWAMYCGEKDPDPTGSGCSGMTASKNWVEKLGAKVVLFIDDPMGDHGGFMTNSANVESLLSAYASVLTTAAAVPTCSVSASPSTIVAGASATLTAGCSPAATGYAWTGGTCANNKTASCSVSPTSTTSYSVKGSNASGVGIVATASVTVRAADTSAPAVPTALLGVALSASQVSLSWTASTDNVQVTGYKVYRDGVLVGSPSEAGYADTGLRAETSYSYTVAACDANTNCSAQTASVSVLTSTASNVVSTSEAECLFNWTEDGYPTFLSPRRPGTATAAPYSYRYYSVSRTYLGVSSQDNNLYFVDGQSGQVLNLGLAVNWSLQAKCR